MNEINSNKKIKIGAIISYVAIAINIVAMLFYTPWMKNQIGISDYGLYTLANSFIAIFLLDFGLGSTISRFIAKYRAEDQVEKANALLGIVYKLYLLIDLAVFLILFILFFFVSDIYVGLTNEEVDKFKILYVIVGFFSLISFPFSTLSGILNAYEQFIIVKVCDLFQKLFSILLVVFALLNHWGVIALICSNAISGIITIVIRLFFVRRIGIKVCWSAKDRDLLKEIFAFSIWSFIMGIAQRLTYNIAPTILGIVSNSANIALYSPASSIAGYFYTFALAINGLFLPSISRKIANNQIDELFNLLLKVGRFQVVVIGLLYVGFWVVGKEFMTLWMGDEFLPSYYCVLLLAFPTIIEYSQQIASTTMIATNRVKYSALCYLGTSLLNVIISPILSYFFGVYGVSLAILISSIVNIIIMNIIYCKVLKLNMLLFYKKCYLPALIPIIGGIILSLYITSLFPLTGWLGLIINAIITACLFFILVFIFYIKKEEKRLIFAKLKFFFHRG